MQVITLGTADFVVSVEAGSMEVGGPVTPFLTFRHVGQIGLKSGDPVDLPHAQLDELTDHSKSFAIQFCNEASIEVVFRHMRALFEGAVNTSSER